MFKIRFSVLSFGLVFAYDLGAPSPKITDSDREIDSAQSLGYKHSYKTILKLLSLLPMQLWWWPGSKEEETEDQHRQLLK